MNTLVVLVDEPCAIFAGQVSSSEFEVYESVAVRDDDEIRVPVNEFLDSHCQALKSGMEFADEGMLLGEARLLRYTIYDSCPGEGVWHDCAGR